MLQKRHQTQQAKDATSLLFSDFARLCVINLLCLSQTLILAYDLFCKYHEDCRLPNWRCFQIQQSRKSNKTGSFWSHSCIQLFFHYNLSFIHIIHIPCIKLFFHYNLSFIHIIHIYSVYRRIFFLQIGVFCIAISVSPYPAVSVLRSLQVLHPVPLDILKPGRNHIITRLISFVLNVILS
jgi:hypothetical protein